MELPFNFLGLGPLKKKYNLSLNFIQKCHDLKDAKNKQFDPAVFNEKFSCKKS